MGRFKHVLCNLWGWNQGPSEILCQSRTSRIRSKLLRSVPADCVMQHHPLPYLRLRGSPQIHSVLCGQDNRLIHSGWRLDPMARFHRVQCDLWRREQGPGEVLRRSCTAGVWHRLHWTIPADGHLQHSGLSWYLSLVALLQAG